MSWRFIKQQPRRLLALTLLCVTPQSAWAGSCSFATSGGTLVDFGLYIALGGDLNKQATSTSTACPPGWSCW